MSHPVAGRVGGAMREPGLLPELHRAILLTVIYSDLFDYPLTDAEVYRYLVADCPEPHVFRQALTDLVGVHLVRTGPFLTLSGREMIVEIRRRREQAAASGWDEAARYARALSRVPFVRMVAVCGSQAAGNAGDGADVDMFIVTERGRLWVVQLCAMLLRRLVPRSSVRVCPNYLLSLDALDVQPQNLYSAREAVQAEPVWGGDTYARFIAENGWIRQFLPQALQMSDRGHHLQTLEPPRMARLVEWLLNGRLGDALDRGVYGLLMLYYPWRLRHLGWQSREVRRAYSRSRQVVMQGGYGPAIARAFRERASAYLGDAVTPDLARLFPSADAAPAAEPDRLYAKLFAERYGSRDE